MSREKDSWIVFTRFIVFSLGNEREFFLREAQQSLEEGNFKKSFEYYQKIEKPTEEILYNMGNILYQEERYDEALEQYKKIASEKLAFEVFYNMGNSYTKLGKNKEAIESYKKALAIKDDKDGRYNLDLLLFKEKQEGTGQKKNKNPNNKDNEANDRRSGSIMEDNNEEFKEDNGRENIVKKGKLSDPKENGNEISNLQTKRDKNEREHIEMNKKLTIKHKRLEDKTLESEDKKWMEILDQREIETLMIPLRDKGAKNGQKNNNPW